jgi:hypothetical protein
MNVTIDTGAGFATIKPDTGTLTSLTFTPASNTTFEDFATNGQLVGPGNKPETFTLTVVDQLGKSFSFTQTIQANSNGAYPFDFAVIGTNGETIQSVTFSAANGIKESKQTEFSLAPAVVAMPEPSTMGLTLSGLASMGLFGLRHLRRRAAPAAS